MTSDTARSAAGLGSAAALFSSSTMSSRYSTFNMTIARVLLIWSVTPAITRSRIDSPAMAAPGRLLTPQPYQGSAGRLIWLSPQKCVVMPHPDR